MDIRTLTIRKSFLIGMLLALLVSVGIFGCARDRKGGSAKFGERDGFSLGAAAGKIVSFVIPKKSKETESKTDNKIAKTDKNSSSAKKAGGVRTVSLDRSTTKRPLVRKPSRRSGDKRTSNEPDISDNPFLSGTDQNRTTAQKNPAGSSVSREESNPFAEMERQKHIEASRPKRGIEQGDLDENPFAVSEREQLAETSNVANTDREGFADGFDAQMDRLHDSMSHDSQEADESLQANTRNSQGPEIVATPPAFEPSRKQKTFSTQQQRPTHDRRRLVSNSYQKPVITPRRSVRQSNQQIEPQHQYSGLHQRRTSTISRTSMDDDSNLPQYHNRNRWNTSSKPSRYSQYTLPQKNSRRIALASSRSDSSSGSGNDMIVETEDVLSREEVRRKQAQGL